MPVGVAVRDSLRRAKISMVVSLGHQPHLGTTKATLRYTPVGSVRLLT